MRCNAMSNSRVPRTMEVHRAKDDNLNNYFASYGEVSPHHILNISGMVNLPWKLQASFISSFQSRMPFQPSYRESILPEAASTVFRFRFRLQPLQRRTWQSRSDDVGHAIQSDLFWKIRADPRSGVSCYYPARNCLRPQFQLSGSANHKVYSGPRRNSAEGVLRSLQPDQLRQPELLQQQPRSSGFRSTCRKDAAISARAVRVPFSSERD